MAFSTHGIVVWKAGGWRQHHIYLSRVMEKGTAYALENLWHLLAQLRDGGYLDGIHTLKIWSDNAPTYKSSELISTVSYRVLDLFKLDRTVCSYGCPKHFKSTVDSIFGQLRHILASAICNVMLINIGNVRKAYMDYFVEEAKIHPAGPAWFFYDFVPERERSTRPSVAFTLKSLGLVRDAFEWSSTRTDRRRINLAAKDNPFRITGIDLRNHLMSGKRATADNTCHPEIDLARIDDKDVPIEAVDGEDKDEVKAVLDRTTREWKGWRCSYSTLEADGDKSRRFHAKLRKTQQVLGHLLRYQVESMRHASDGALKARAVDRNGKSALRKRTEREHFRKRAGAESTDSSSSDSSS
jgi:hypothetical protein